MQDRLNDAAGSGPADPSGSSSSSGPAARWARLRGAQPRAARLAAELPANAVAGLTLAALSIPEVMGYTRIAGTPVVTGLYTMLLPMLLFAAFGASRHLVVAADSATAAILASTLSALAVRGSAQWTALAGSLAVIVAALLLAARLLRLGFLADFLSRTVLVGFLTGVGLQVAVGELPPLLGLQPEGHGTLPRLAHALGHLREAHAADAAVALAMFAVILVLRRLSRRVPAALIAVAGAILASWALDLPAHGVHVIGPVSGGLPRLGWPQTDWSLSMVVRLLPSAAAMSVVILAQSAATSRAFATRHGESYAANGDLLGLSLANIGAALSGTFVVNGSPTKTQMVDSAGGTRQLAHLVACAVVAAVLLFATAPLAYLPEAALSAVVCLIGLELIDLRGLRRIWAARPSEFWVALTAAAVVVAVSVEQGILAAMTLSLIEHVRRGYRPRNALLAEDGSGHLRPLPVDSRAELLPGLVVYRFSHGMYYANAEQLGQELSTLAGSVHPRWLCIDMAAVSDVDYSAGETLRQLIPTLQRAGVQVVLAEVADDVRRELHRYGVIALLPPPALCETVGDVVRHYTAHAAQPAPAPGAPGKISA